MIILNAYVDHIILNRNDPKYMNKLPNLRTTKFEIKDICYSRSTKRNKIAGKSFHILKNKKNKSQRRKPPIHKRRYHTLVGQVNTSLTHD